MKPLLLFLLAILVFSTSLAQTSAKAKNKTASSQAAVKESKTTTVKMANETYVKRPKTSDKQQEKVKDFIKGRKAAIKPHRRTKKTEDPDQGGEVVKQKSKNAAIRVKH